MSQTPSFNLIDRPWLPAVRRGGNVTLTSLRELFAQAHELERLELESPDVMAGVYRMLLAILHRAYEGPRSRAEWASIWNTRRFDTARVDAYLERWRDRFDLWHPKYPFFQAPAATGEEAPVSRLFADRAKGNNPTLFDHSLDDGFQAVGADVAARRLIGAQVLALGGRIAGAAKNAVDGPLARGATFLLTGTTLFETLALNLLVWTRSTPVPATAGDVPSWETRPSDVEERPPRGHLDLMTWRPRAYRLVSADPAGLFVRGVLPSGEANRCVRPEGHRDPFMAQRSSQTAGMLDLRIDPARALWRDSLPLFRGDGADGRRPACVEQLATLGRERVVPRHQRVAVSVFGFSTDQAKVELGRVESIPLPVTLLDGAPEPIDALRGALERAEELGKKLYGAVYKTAELSIAFGSDAEGARQPRKEDVRPIVESTGASEAYWSSLGVAFPAFLLGVAESPDEAASEWIAAIRSAARHGFRRAAVKLGTSARGLKAVAVGEAQLARSLSTLFPKQEVISHEQHPQ